MGGSFHRLELILVGVVMLLTSILIGAYMLIRPETPATTQASLRPLRHGVDGVVAPTAGSAEPPQLVPTVLASAATNVPTAGSGGPEGEPAALRTALALPLGLQPWMLAGILVTLLGSLLFRQRLSPALLAPSRGSSLLGRQHAQRGWSRALQRIFAVPAADPLIQVRGELLKWASLLIGSSGALALLISLLKHAMITWLPYEILGLLGVCALVFALAHTGRLVAGGLILGLGLIPLILYLEPLSTLLERPFGAAFIVPVLIVGLVVGANAARWTGGLVLGIVLLLSILAGAPASRWSIDLLMLLTLESGLIWLTIRTMERALLAVRKAAALEQEHTLLERHHRESERQAVVLANQLEQQQQAREFVGHFLHELGGLAVGAKGALEVMPVPSLVPQSDERFDDDLFDDEAGGAEGLVDALKESIEEMHLLLDDLKILLRQGSLAETQWKPIEVTRLFAQVEQVAFPAYGAIEVEVEISPPDLVVYGDEALLRRALLTALRNAEHAITRSARGSQPSSIRVQGFAEHDWVYLRVEDHGPGFPPAMLRKMRALVMRPSGTLPIGWFTDTSGGTGRGIPLLDQVARLHQGSLGFGNQLGEPGAWVQLQLPSQRRQRGHTARHADAGVREEQV